MVAWAEMTAAALSDLAERGAVALAPVASTEQHGPHMATGTDALLAAEVCRRAAALMAAEGRPAVVAPALWLGLAEHHMAFGGTFTLGLATYRAVLGDLCRSVARAGFGRLVIVNGHGGNMTALNAMSAELQADSGIDLAVTTYFQLAEAEIAQVLEDQPGVLHAGEAETSMMLAIRPDLVDLARLPEAHGPSAAAAGAVLSAPFHRWRSFAALTPSGVLGDARRASAAKGERLLDACAAALAARAGDPATWA